FFDEIKSVATDDQFLAAVLPLSSATGWDQHDPRLRPALSGRERQHFQNHARARSHRLDKPLTLLSLCAEALHYVRVQKHKHVASLHYWMLRNTPPRCARSCAAAGCLSCRASFCAV